MAKGCSCSDPDLVVVKDRSMSLPYVSGNAYSRYCRTCGRRYFCKKSFWKRAAEKFIIPRDSSDPVSAEDFAGNDTYDNFFTCPGCDEPHFGYPSDCDCGAEYEWPDQDSTTGDGDGE